MEPSQEPISVRINRIDSLLLGKLHTSKCSTHLLSKESLLDALQLLYDECNTDHLKNSDKNIKQFVEKNRKCINVLKQIRVNLADFEIKNVVGRGHFGEVHLVKEKQTGDIYAMKTIKKYKSLEQYSSFEEERNIMALSVSPWITKLQYAFQDSANLYFVMEYHPGGDLFGLLNRQGGTLPESAASFYIAEVVLGLNDLHNMGFVHRDVKPDNILLDRCGHIKLADFGSASRLDHRGEISHVMPIGTPEYIAPEILQSLDNKNENVQYGVTSDYWSLGILAYELTIGETPFSGQNTSTVYSNILNHTKTLKFPHDIVLSQAYVSLVQGLLGPQNSRLTYKEIVVHPLYNSLDFTTLRDQVPPYVPTITSIDDTSNFTDILIRKNEPHIDSFKKKTQFSGKNLPFIGFTYTTQLENGYKDNSYSSRSLIKDETLTSMKKEIERLQKSVLKSENSLLEVENLGKKYEEKCRKLESIENIRNSLEKDLANSIAECSALKRTIDLERKDRKDLERKALDLIKSAKTKWEASEKVKLDALQDEISNQQQKILNLENQNLNLKEQLQQLSNLEDMHKASLEKVENLSRRSVVTLESKLQKVATQSQNNISAIETKLKAEINKNASLESKLMKCEKSNREIEKQLDAQTHKLNLLQQNYMETTIKVKNQEALVEELEKYKAETAKSKHKIKELEEANQQLETNLHNYTSTEQKLKKEIGKLTSFEKEIEALKSELEFEKISHKTILEEVSEQKKLEINNLNRELKEALSKNIENERRIKEADLNEENYRTAIKTLEDLLAKLQNGVTKLESSSENQSVLQQQVERLEKELVEAHQVFAVEKQEYSQIKAKHWRLEKDLQNATLDKKIIERDLKEVQEQYAKALVDIESLNTKISETKKMHEKALLELNKLNENLTNEVVRLTDLIKSLEGKLDLEKEKCDDEKTVTEQLKLQVLEKEKEYQTLHREYGSLSLERNNYEKQLMNCEASNKKLVVQLERLMAEKSDLLQEIDTCKREQQNNQANRNALREACTVLENQLEEFEQLYNVSEDKRNTLRAEIEKIQSELVLEREKVLEAKKLANEEKSFKLLAENKCKKLLEDIEHLKAENSSYKDQCKEFKSYSSVLTGELNLSEQKASQLETEIKNLTRRVDDCLAENKILKEENSFQLTHLNSVKESNYKLMQDINDLKSANNSMLEQIEQMNNILLQKDMYQKERELKSESTIQQQTKLIDFLQSKLQMEEQKKKKTLSDKLFGNTKKENQPPLPLILNYKDLEHQLNKEKEITKNLRQEIITLKSHLYPDNIDKTVVVNVKDQKRVLEQIVQSPQRNELYRQNSVQRMHHNIPHRFETKLCTKLVACTHCKNQIPLGRNLCICSECLITAHPHCIENLPRTCGLPQAYAKHYSDSLSKLQNVKNQEEGESKESTAIDIESWVKIPVKTSWEKYYACLTPNAITIYEEPPNHKDVKVAQTLELMPADSYGKVTLEPVVSEIGIPVANSDLPFVLKVEICPNTTCWPSKYLIFMTLNIEDKENWYKALENILSKSCGKYKGEDIHELSADLDVNCLIEIDKEIRLLGTDKGLYSYYMRKLNHISGPLHIHQIGILPKLNLALMIVDDIRVLISCDLRHLHSLCECAPCSNPTLQFKTINAKGMSGFHLFQTTCSKRYMLCAANARQLLTMKYDFKCKEFIPERILDTAQPTSCILFTEHSLIIGADKFFEIDLATYHADEFLDGSDKELSSAIECYKLRSFPLAILRIAKNPAEYLVCFHEFSAFVDEYGRNTRPNEMKWTHLPHAFHFDSGYLYVIHFYGVEIIKITLDANDSTTSADLETRKIEFQNLKYVGAGANGIYIKSGKSIKFINAKNVDPNSSSVSLSNDTEQEDCESDRFSFTSSIVQSLDGNLSDNENVTDTLNESPKKVKFASDL